MKASRALKEASDVIAESPAALQVWFEWCHRNPQVLWVLMYNVASEVFVAVVVSL
jgi:hypothetical protein